LQIPFRKPIDRDSNYSIVGGGTEAVTVCAVKLGLETIDGAEEKEHAGSDNSVVLNVFESAEPRCTQGYGEKATCDQKRTRAKIPQQLSKPKEDSSKRDNHE
jgi:hypothetical protein